MFNQALQERANKDAANQAILERESREDSQREAALQGYIDKLSELLLVNGLRHSKAGDEVRTIARMRTVAVVQGLDGIRKRILIIFLHESGLINRKSMIVELWGVVFNNADFSGIDLRDADLHGTMLYNVKLSGTLLNGADLSYANLRKANFSGTDLTNVNFKGASLEGASLRGAILN